MPTPYPGAFGASMQFVEEFPGQLQLEDILDGSGEDYLYVEQEFGGPPTDLSALAGGPSGLDSLGGGMGMDMGAPGMPSMPGMASPMDAPSDPGADMRDLLAERAKARMTASEAFQQKARQMTGSGPFGSGY